MRKKININEAFIATQEHMSGEGILLLAGDPPNPMTIGWGLTGIVWGKPVFAVFVRPTRYTHQLMEKSKFFTVNILPSAHADKVTFCGTHSGKDVDKLEKCQLNLASGLDCPTPFLTESVMHFECRIIHKNIIDDKSLEEPIIGKYYPKRDFHTVYYGEILGIYRR